MNSWSETRALLSALKSCAICAVGMYGAGLLSIVVHETGHAVAGRLGGGRVLRIVVDTALRGRSRTLLYYPFAERVGHLDSYWVALGGLSATAVLGAIGVACLFLSKRQYGLLAGMMIVGTTLGAVGIGALRYALTGDSKEATDVFLFSHLVNAPAGRYRLLVGCVGAILLAGTGVIIGARLVRDGRGTGTAGDASGRIQPLAAMCLVSIVMSLWYFGVNALSLIVALVIAVYCGGVGAMLWRAGRVDGWAAQLPRGLAVEAIALVGAAFVLLAIVRLSVPANGGNELSVPRGNTEQDLRLAAYWAAEQGDHAKARNLLEDAAKRWHTSGVLYDLGTAYRVAGRTQEAIARLTEACKIAPELEACWAQLARAYEEAGENRLAASAWRTAASLEASNPDRPARDRRMRLMESRAVALESAKSAR